MRYNPKAIEKKWQRRWLKERIYEPDFKKAKRPFYNLMMFPYPSAEGLHIGAVRTFSGVDIYGRFKRMQGYDVFEPIGLDGFGIHSENYALKIGKHPKKHASDSEKNFYRQLSSIGNGFAWDEKLETYHLSYYKWTQWIFIQMFKHGLAYRKRAEVNWCPSCMTVLADEQVIQKSQIPNPKSQINSKSQILNSKQKISIGVCERCDTPVIKKELEQWFFKITKYAERLLKNLDKIDWSEQVKAAQRNWIGRSEGILIKFRISSVPAADFINGHRGGLIKSAAGTPLSLSESDSHSYIEVFTTRPDTLFGVTYVVLGPEHTIIQNSKFKIQNLEEVENYVKITKSRTNEEHLAKGREKTGVELKGIKAINPANNEEIPVWVADYVLGDVGTGAIMAVPAHDDRDLEFALSHKLQIKLVVLPKNITERAYGGGRIEKMSDEKFSESSVLASIIKTGYAIIGEGGMINSGKFNGMPSEKAKKEITKFVGGEKQVNYRLRDWLISRQRYWGPPIPMIYCGKCDWQPVPEKDLPVLLPNIKDFRPTGTDRGPLAAVEKFYKVRCPKCKAWAKRETDVSDSFLDSSWYFLRYPSNKSKKNSWDPTITKKWLPVDMYIGGAEHSVLHLMYSRFVTMAFCDWGMLDFEEPFNVFRIHGLITKDGFKMSKSRGNVVNPDEYLKAYGIDAIRMYLAFLAPFNQGGDFRNEGIRGITRFLEKVWRLASSTNNESNANIRIRKFVKDSLFVDRVLHKTIKKVTEDIEALQYNTAIAALMVLLNEFEENKDSVDKSHIQIFLKLLAPFAPFLTEELWQEHFGIKKYKSIHKEQWPDYDPKLIKEEKFSLIIQINGKVRDKLETEAGIDKSKAEELTFKREKVRMILGNQKPKRVIFVPDRLINIVV